MAVGSQSHQDVPRSDTGRALDRPFSFPPHRVRFRRIVGGYPYECACWAWAREILAFVGMTEVGFLSGGNPAGQEKRNRASMIFCMASSNGVLS